MTSALPGRAELRSSKQYARVDGVWYESAHAFKDAFPIDASVKLFAPATGLEFRVPGAEIESMEGISVRAKYRGLWFLVNSFWSTPEGPDWNEPERGRIRGSIVPGAPDCFAYLLYRGPAGEGWKCGSLPVRAAWRRRPRWCQASRLTEVLEDGTQRLFAVFRNGEWIPQE